MFEWQCRCVNGFLPQRCWGKTYLLPSKKNPKKFQTKLIFFNFFSLSHANNVFFFFIYWELATHTTTYNFRYYPWRQSRRHDQQELQEGQGVRCHLQLQAHSTSHLPSTTHPHQLHIRVYFTSTCKVGEIQTHPPREKFPNNPVFFLLLLGRGGRGGAHLSRPVAKENYGEIIEKKVIYFLALHV